MSTLKRERVSILHYFALENHPCKTCRRSFVEAESKSSRMAGASCNGHTYIDIYINYIHTQIHTYKHTYTHTYITYIHTYVRTCRTPGFLASWTPGFLASWTPGFLASISTPLEKLSPPPRKIISYLYPPRLNSTLLLLTSLGHIQRPLVARRFTLASVQRLQKAVSDVRLAYD